MSERAPALDPALVEAFVANAHGRIDEVRSALAEHPALVNAAWDWGDGDVHAEAGGEQAKAVLELLG